MQVGSQQLIHIHSRKGWPIGTKVLYHDSMKYTPKALVRVGMEATDLSPSQ